LKSPHKQYLLTIAVLIVIIVLLRECSGGGEPCPEITSTTIEYDTIEVAGDSIPYTVEVEVPKPYKVLDVRSIPADVDTSAILADFFRQYLYSDTIRIDSTYLVILDDTISQNRIEGRGVQFQQLRDFMVVKTITNNVEDPNSKPRFKMYAGGFVGGNLKQFDAGPEMLFQTKKDHVYGLQWSPFTDSYYVKTHFKISFKKKNP